MGNAAARTPTETRPASPELLLESLENSRKIIRYQNDGSPDEFPSAVSTS